MSLSPSFAGIGGFMADSARWERFRFRPDDVVISTPSKCGTTWMQKIVGMLVLDRVDLGAPLSTVSPWLDMLWLGGAPEWEFPRHGRRDMRCEVFSCDQSPTRRSISALCFQVRSPFQGERAGAPAEVWLSRRPSAKPRNASSSLLPRTGDVLSRF